MLDGIENVIDPMIVPAALAAFLGYKLVRWILATRTAAKEFVIHVIDERLPASIKAALNNGISDMVRQMNAEQDKRWGDTLRAEFAAHELREKESVQTLVETTTRDNHICRDDVLAKLEEHDKRLRHIETKLPKRKDDKEG